MDPRFNTEGFIKKLFNINSPDEFNGLALELFQYQARHNKVYAAYLANLGVNIKKVKNIEEIPFLPISLFKTHRILSGNFKVEADFSSSGTTGMDKSHHYLRSIRLYKESFIKAFTCFYGDPSAYRFLGLLPSYLERKGSSLIYMVQELIKAGAYPESGFYLDEFDQLKQQLKGLDKARHQTILIGVGFALLDFAEKHSFPLGRNIIVMETGGMKGRREELTRQDLHNRLCGAFGVRSIHSEYGMTELLSQAYSKGQGRFLSPPWMKVLVRDIQDPFSLLDKGRSGGLNIIDLANIHSCAFIETQDIGRILHDGAFEVLGRTDSSDIRGCSLLIA